MSAFIHTSYTLQQCLVGEYPIEARARIFRGVRWTSYYAQPKANAEITVVRTAVCIVFATRPIAAYCGCEMLNKCFLGTLYASISHPTFVPHFINEPLNCLAANN